jgi:hypothetical protein
MSWKIFLNPQNPKQKLSLITFVEKLRQAHEKMDGIEEGYTKAIVSYLALGVERLASFLPTNLQKHGRQ